MKNEGMVSVVIPCFNAARHICATIISIKNQTYKNLEIILIDDCSTDETLNVIESCVLNFGEIKILKTEKNSGGPATPRNIGLAACRGDYVAFCDSDDVWHPQKLEIQLEYLQNHDFVCTSLNVFESDDELKYKKFSNFDFEYKVIEHKELIKKNFIANSSVVLKRNVINGFVFSTDKNLVAVEDYELWLRLFQRQNVRGIKLQANLLFYRVVENSISRSKFNMLKKINYLLKNYEINNKKIGISRYYYILTYVYGSLTKKIR